MKFSGDFISNYSYASGTKNIDYRKDVILDEIARLIELKRPAVINALKDAGYDVGQKPRKREIASKTVDALYDSKQFRHNISAEIAKENAKFSSADNAPLSNAANLAKPSAGASSGVAVDPVSWIAQAAGQIFGGFGQAKAEKNKAEAEKEKTKQQMFEKLFASEQKNYLPVIVVVGVLLIGGIVAFATLRNKKAAA